MQQVVIFLCKYSSMSVLNSHFGISLIFLLVLLCTIMSDCPNDGIWPKSRSGSIVELKCSNPLIGPLIRYCHINDRWGLVENNYCLPRSPPYGKAFIDFTYLISYANKFAIIKKPEGLIRAMKAVYPILENYSIGIYRVAKEEQMVKVLNMCYL